MLAKSYQDKDVTDGGPTTRALCLYHPDGGKARARARRDCRGSRERCGASCRWLVRFRGDAKSTSREGDEVSEEQERHARTPGVD